MYLASLAACVGWSLASLNHICSSSPLLFRNREFIRPLYKLEAWLGGVLHWRLHSFIPPYIRPFFISFIINLVFNIKFPDVLFLLKLYILYVFLPHLLFFVVGVHNDYTTESILDCLEISKKLSLRQILRTSVGSRTLHQSITRMASSPAANPAPSETTWAKSPQSAFFSALMAH